MIKSLCILGSGGHTLAVLTALSGSQVSVSNVYDDDPAVKFTLCGKYKVTTGIPLEFDPGMGDAAAIAIGNNLMRRRVALVRDSWPFANLVHSSVVVNEHGTTLGKGVLMMPNTVVGGDVRIGNFVILNTGSLVAHNSTVGDFAHLSGHVCMGGGVSIGEGALIGLNATILPGISVGAWSVVGAGAVVTRDVPAGVVVMGNPARIVRRQITAAAE
jgi:sugar O-acyltransferase (sialic acid O-acetyltransferase NeuD family)